MNKLELQVASKKLSKRGDTYILKCHNYKDKYLNREITIVSRVPEFSNVEYGDVVCIKRDLSKFSDDGSTIFYDDQFDIIKVNLNDVLMQMIMQDNKLTKDELLTFQSIVKDDIVEFFLENTQDYILSELNDNFSYSKVTYLIYKSYELIEVFKISEILTKHNLEVKFALDIYLTLGRDAVSLLNKNLLFALRVIPLNILTAAVEEINQTGEIYIKYLSFINKGQAYVSEHDLGYSSNTLNQHPMLQHVNGYYVDKYVFRKESFIYNYLDTASKEKVDCDNYHYDELSHEQNNVVNNSMQNKVSIITGGPGTGKTTTIVKLIQSLETEFKFEELQVLASTGSASDVLSNKIYGHEAQTLHTYIEKLKRGHVPAPIIIIDESSMIDVDVMFQFIKLISPHHISHLVFVGDEDQLPSVEYGYVLTNMLKKQYNVGKLTITFR